MQRVLADGLRTADIDSEGKRRVGTSEMVQRSSPRSNQYGLAGQSIEVRVARSPPMQRRSMPRFLRRKVVAETPAGSFTHRWKVWRKRLLGYDEDDYFLVACVHDRLVGTVGLHRTHKSPRRRHAAGIGLAVQDDWQGKGVGSALLERRCSISLTIGSDYTRLELTVFTDNEAAIAVV